MKKIVVAVGCRPDCIKMMPLLKELKKRNDVEAILLSTGQHREMLKQVFDDFGQYPDYDLDIMTSNQTLFDITESIIHKLNIFLKEISPDIVLVHGDTTTAFAVALSCFYQQIPVGHVEAGLRTYNIFSPYPEEFNREAVGLIAQYHFAPTSLAKKNLISERKDPKTIFVTGNTIIDSMKYTVSDEYHHPELDWVGGSRMILITAHRRENLGQPMRNMFRAIKRVLLEHQDTKAIYPIHMNPIVRKIAKEELFDCSQIHIIEPLEVKDCHNFEKRAFLILTDSGGIQEEAPAYGVPVLVMRNTTERPEGVEAGTLKLVGTDEDNIYRNFSLLLDNKNEYEKMSKASNPYGDGNASQRIVGILLGEKVKEWEQ